MDKKTIGAWLVHHTNKLEAVSYQRDYQKTSTAGKAGILLSAISSDDEHKSTTLNMNRLEVLAEAANINPKLELPALLSILEKQRLIDSTDNGVCVLGVTSASVLSHTADIFRSLSPSQMEKASILLAEKASEAPVFAESVSEELSDTFKISDSKMSEIISGATKIGFVDSENIDHKNSLLFNGNLFRREAVKKYKTVIDTLTRAEKENIDEVSSLLQNQACLLEENVKHILGDNLYSKVFSIGLFDLNVVANSTETMGFITLPSAFSKYSNSMIEDAFDFAKAFVSSITYGMHKSCYERGQIRVVEKLLQTLISGQPVGPVKAIAEDYRILEIKGVVQVKNGTKNGRIGPLLYLKKKEVGELALLAIQKGNISDESLTCLPTATITKYAGPEINRQIERKKQLQSNPTALNDMLSILRTGGV